MSIVRPILSAAMALVLAMLAGCGSAPPAPTDRFYRLQAEAPPASHSGAGVDIRSIRADSLYAERPIVFVRADDPRQLQQYHYHLWLHPPAQTVREHLRTSLGNGVGRKALALDIRVVNFERVLDGKASQAQAGLEVTLSGAAGVLLEKRYRATQPATDESFSAFAAAMETALKRIYGELLQDLDGIEAKTR